MIPKSKMYKAVDKESKIILFEGNAKQMLKIVKQSNGKLFVGNAPGKNIGDIFK